MTFEWPLALLGLAALPLLVALYVVLEGRRRRFAARFSNPALLPNVVDRAPGRRRHLPLAVLLVALALMIVGVARPHATVSVAREDATVILAMDVSRSMTAKDVRPSRLAAARSAARAFLARVPRKFRVGIVAFATRATPLVPPTTDRFRLAEGLAALSPGQGTALGDAVDLSVRLGRRERGKDGTIPPTAILLLSDGAQQGGRTTVATAAREARSLHVPVYAILVGTPDGVVERPLVGGYREITRVPPNPAALRAFASITGGRFFTARDDARLREVYEHLGSRLGRHRQPREITDVFAGGSAMLLLAGGALSAFWFRRVP